MHLSSAALPFNMFSDLFFVPTRDSRYNVKSSPYLLSKSLDHRLTDGLWD